MSLPQRTCTLIVGAGPTGLATALSLIHHGFQDFVIVDALSKGENSSRAILVHAATMDVCSVSWPMFIFADARFLQALDTIGCGDEITSKGAKLPCITQSTRTTTLTQVPFECLKQYTKHTYGLIIPQLLTEHALGQKLASFGVKVHRPYRVVGMKPNSDDVKLADVTFEDGQVITAKYIIAADGAHSTVG